jgi:outer membrane phospholipase A
MGMGGLFGVSLNKNDNLNLATHLRAGQSFHYGAVQVDLTYPFDNIFKTFAGYFLIQYWNGYGESLLNYNQRADTIRFVISLVRQCAASVRGREELS